MRKRIGLTLIITASIFLLGCNSFTNLTTTEAVYKVFKEYDRDKEAGLVEVSE